VRLDFNNFQVADDSGGGGLRPTQGRYGRLVERNSSVALGPFPVEPTPEAVTGHLAYNEEQPTAAEGIMSRSG
jgi:hypothetical protein